MLEQLKSTRVRTIDTQETVESRISLFDVLIVLARGKWIWIAACFAFGILGWAITYLMPVEYRAETDILPPQQPTSTAALLSSQLGSLVGLAGAQGGLGIKNPDDVFVAILKSRTVADDLVKRFDLCKVYKRKDTVLAAKDLASHSHIDSDTSGVITVKVDDRDPKRSAAIANGYIDELHVQNDRLALTEAGQRRLFFERQLDKEKDALADSEVAMKETEMKTGVIELQGQTALALRSVASLEAEITSDEVELQQLLTSETAQNPDVIRIQQRISYLQQQLDKAEKQEPKELGGNNGLSMQASSVPNLALDYIRKMRDVKYHETLFELLARQYEAAKIDESKQAPAIQVVDAAVPPHFKYWPPRKLFAAACAAFGLLAGWAFTLAAESLRRTLSREPYATRWRELRQAIRG
jgi:tyrosine-protein kinase Etk/Wzc